jgi:hypothetical protein
VTSSDGPHDDAPTGPGNPRGAAGPDAPAPPGGPMRADAPAGPETPGGPRGRDGGPDASRHAGSQDESPGTDPSRSDPQPEPTATGEIHAQTQTDQVNEELQEENAETSLDQPSDGSGGE